MFTTYVLWSEAIGRHYVGHTEDLARRLTEHRNAHSGFTSQADDWRAVYQRSFPDRAAAARHERRIKKTGVRIFLSTLVTQAGLSPAASPSSAG